MCACVCGVCVFVCNFCDNHNIIYVSINYPPPPPLSLSLPPQLQQRVRALLSEIEELRAQSEHSGTRSKQVTMCMHVYTLYIP